MFQERLTSRSVKALCKPGTKIRRYGDGAGLWLVVGRLGNASWIYRATIKGRRTEIGLGSVRFVSLQEARKLAAGYACAVFRGEDPAQERRLARQSNHMPSIPTFAGCMESVIAERRSTTWKRPDAQESAWRNALSGMLRAVGDLPVNEIKPPQVREVLMRLYGEKPETARKTMHNAKAVFDYASSQGWAVGNPLASFSFPKVARNVQHREALAYDKVSGAIKSVRAKSRVSEITKLCFEFVVLTAGRNSESCKATWDEFDLDANVWHIGGERMKANKAHRVPLSERCIEILRLARAKSNGSKFVFPSPKDGEDEEDKHITPQTLQAKMKGMIGTTGRQATVHGMRSSFRDWAAECTDAPAEVCEAALAHAKGAVERAYNRTDLFKQRARLMAQWAAYLRG